ncbi:M23 family metallopeptidase [Blastococcus sp. SYSU DS0619]
MSSLHHDRLLEEGAAPATAPAASRSTRGDVEGKAGSTVPSQRQGKAQPAGDRRTTDPTTRPAAARAAGTLAARAKAARATTAKAAGATAATTARAATAKAATARAATRKAATAARTAAAAKKAAAPELVAAESAAAKSTAAKSTAAKSTAAKSTAAKSTAAKSTAAKSTAAKSTAAKSAAAKSAAAKSTAAPRRPQVHSGGRHRAEMPAAGPLPGVRAAVVRAIAAKVAADAAPVRRRPTPYKRSAVDLGALAPVTDVAALVQAPSAAPEAVVVVKDVPAAPPPAAVSVEPVPADVTQADRPDPEAADSAGVVAAVAGGRRGLLTPRPPSGRRRSAFYLAAVLVGALGVSGAAVGEPATVETRTVSHSVSVAAQLGIAEGAAATEVVDEEDTSRLREMVVSRNVRDAERTAAADAQAEADRLAAEEAARIAAEAARPQAVLPVAGARITSGFGARWGTLHAGIDFAAPMRTPEYAVMDGVVLEAGAASGFGLAVYIQHDNGDVTVYGHMDEILVEPGQIVRAGDTIALLGNRGQSTGPHLHFEVHVGGIDGQRIDPLPWLRERGLDV